MITTNSQTGHALLHHFSGINLSLSRRNFIASATACAAMSLAAGTVGAAPKVMYGFIYEEKINNILFAPQGNKLIVLGERYHYMFDDKAALDQVLAASFKEDLTGAFGSFSVNAANSITGSYSITSRKQLEGEQASEAQRLGFVALPDGRHELKASISGYRFTTEPLPISTPGPALNERYAITVYVQDYVEDDPHAAVPDSPALAAAKAIIATPLFVLAALFSGDPRFGR